MYHARKVKSICLYRLKTNYEKRFNSGRLIRRGCWGEGGLSQTVIRIEVKRIPQSNFNLTLGARSGSVVVVGVSTNSCYLHFYESHVMYDRQTENEGSWIFILN